MTAPPPADPVAARLVEIGPLLARLVALLMLDKPSLADHEGPTAINLENSAWATAGVDALSAADLRRLSDLCAGALSLEFRVDELSILTVEPGLTDESFESFRLQAKGVEEVVVSLRLDKVALIARLLAAQAGAEDGG